MDEEFTIAFIAIGDKGPSTDPQITKIVIASSEQEAITKAKEAVKRENPEFNLLRAWAHHIERRPLG